MRNGFWIGVILLWVPVLSAHPVEKTQRPGIDLQTPKEQEVDFFRTAHKPAPAELPKVPPYVSTLLDDWCQRVGSLVRAIYPF